VKEILLTQGKVALVDDADYEWLSQYKWYAHEDCKTFYVRRMSKTVNGKRKMLQMHIELIGRKEGLVTDHINGNGLDNRRENLRHVTQSQNCLNRHTKISKYPGVTWSKFNKKWYARITVDNNRLHLGYFVNEADAYRAYCDANKRFTGNETIFDKTTTGII